MGNPVLLLTHCLHSKSGSTPQAEFECAGVIIFLVIFIFTSLEKASKHGLSTGESLPEPGQVAAWSRHIESELTETHDVSIILLLIVVIISTVLKFTAIDVCIGFSGWSHK